MSAMARQQLFIRINRTDRPVKPIVRRLRMGQKSFTLQQALKRPGGLILGEGDTGKSTYVQMLADAARANGPVLLVPLREGPHAEPFPKPRKGETVTVIYDGLDERPEFVHDLRRLAEELSSHRSYRLWVTSRPCKAASFYGGNGFFPDVYDLVPFSENDVRKLAESLKIDPDDFLELVYDRGLEAFLQKPGGAVLMLNLFVTGKLKADTATGLMRDLAYDLLSETRDDKMAMTDDSDDIPNRLRHAFCLSACLDLTFADALWTGPATCRPHNDLMLSDIPSARFDAAEVNALLKTRLFEPLETCRYRISYSEMPWFLTGTWLAEHATDDEFRRLTGRLGDNAYYSVPMAAWASCLRPELGMADIVEDPFDFTRCHALIRRFGFDAYLSACCTAASNILDDCIADRRVLGCVFSLAGFTELGDWLLDVLNHATRPPRELACAAMLLLGCDAENPDYGEAVRDCAEHLDDEPVRAFMLNLVECGPEAPLLVSPSTLTDVTEEPHDAERRGHLASWVRETLADVVLLDLRNSIHEEKPPEASDTSPEACGVSRCAHVGETLGGIGVAANGRQLLIGRLAPFMFRGAEQWKVIDRLVDAWFDNKKAEIGQKPAVAALFTSKDGRRLMQLIHFETYAETRTKSPGRNAKFTGRAYFSRELIARSAVKPR